MLYLEVMPSGVYTIPSHCFTVPGSGHFNLVELTTVDHNKILSLLSIVFP